MRMRELNQAYAVLKDPEQRARYDAGARASGATAAPPIASCKRPTDVAVDRSRAPFGEAGPPRRPGRAAACWISAATAVGRWARSRRTTRTSSSGSSAHPPGATCEERSPSIRRTAPRSRPAAGPLAQPRRAADASGSPAWPALAHGDALRIPSAMPMLISDAPPWVMNGSGMPVTGIMPSTMPTLTSSWNSSIEAMRAGERQAERVPGTPADQHHAPDQRREQEQHQDRRREAELLAERGEREVGGLHRQVDR